MDLTSSSVKPNLSSDILERMLFTLRLFTPENIPVFASCITPVTYAIWRLGLLFRVADMNELR